MSRRRTMGEMIAAFERRVARSRPRRPRPDPLAGPCPVGPDRPLDLSGGAAAVLEFDA